MGSRLVVLTPLLLACGGLALSCGDSPSPPEAVTSGDPADMLALASASGQKVIDSGAFRFEVRDLSSMGASKARCHPGADRTTGAMDPDRPLAVLDLDGGDPVDAIVSETTVYLRASVLDGWKVPSRWLSVPLADRTHLGLLDPAIGGVSSLGPTFWNGRDQANPVTALAGIRDSATAVTEKGRETVRGVETTRYGLTLDPNRPEARTGTTAPSAPPTSVSPAERAAREERLNRAFQDPRLTSLPDDVRESVLDGDTGPLFDHVEKVTGEPVPSEQRELIEMILGLGDHAASPPDLPTVFGALVTYEMDVYVDDGGLLRRLDVRVRGRSTGGTTPRDGSQYFLNLSVDYWDIGSPLAAGEPPASEVTAVADLAPGDAPTRPPPCRPAPGR